MSPVEQEEAEKEVIHQLQEKPDMKKRAHEREWFQKVETNAIASDEEDDGDVVKEYELNNEDKVGCDESEEEEWVPEDSGNEGDKDSSDFGFVNDLVEARSSKAFRATLKSVEEAAKKKEE